MYKDNNIKEVCVSYHLIKPVSKQTLVSEDALDLKYKVYSIKYVLYACHLYCSFSRLSAIQNIILAVPSFSLSNVINVALQNTLVGGKGRMYGIYPNFTWVYHAHLIPLSLGRQIFLHFYPHYLQHFHLHH